MLPNAVEGPEDGGGDAGQDQVTDEEKEEKGIDQLIRESVCDI